MIPALVAVALGLAVAQSPPQADNAPAAAPPGTVKKPAGALKGGSVEPYIGDSAKPKRDVKRCEQLAGRLRKECLRDLRDGSDAGKPAPAAGRKRS